MFIICNNFIAPIHTSQAAIMPTPVRPFQQQQQQHISFQDPFPMKSSEHNLVGSSHGSRVGSALGMVSDRINSPTDYHTTHTAHSHHGVGKYFYHLHFGGQSYYNIDMES